MYNLRLIFELVITDLKREMRNGYLRVNVMFKIILKMLGFGQKATKNRSVSKHVEKSIVSTLSRGNIHLQQGRYLTSTDIDAMREKAFR